MKQTGFTGIVLMLLIMAQVPVFALQTVAADGSGDFLTIQEGLDAAAVGEEVHVIDGGTYAESLNINGEILISDPVGATIDAGGNNGAIVWGDTDATIDGFTISNAINGVHIDGSPTNVQIMNCTLNATTGVNFGDGVSKVTITNCTINADAHGVLFNAGVGHTLNIDDCTIHATNEHGVTLYQPATVIITDSYITNCGQCGIRTDNAGEPVITVTNTQILNNGSCIGLMRKGMYTFTDCLIDSNGGVTSDGNWQGGFFVDSAAAGATVNITNTSISNNVNHGFFAGRAITLNMAGCTINGNGGRGVWVDDFAGTTSDDQNTTVSDCLFSNNEGPGLTVAAKDSNATAIVTDCIFNSNATLAATLEANNSGSGKTVLVDVERNKFLDGSANNNTVLNINVAAPGSKVINNLFDQGDPSLAITNSMVDVFNNTFVGTADSTGIDVSSLENKTVNIENNIIAGQTTGVISSSNPDGLDNLTVDYNMLQTLTADYDENITPLAGPNNLTGMSPEFLQPSDLVGMGDYRLALTSPAVDAGIDLGVSEDLKGNPRDTVPDIGAYEYESPVNIVISDWTVY